MNRQLRNLGFIGIILTLILAVSLSLTMLVGAQTPTPSPTPTATPTPTPTPVSPIPPEVSQYASDWPLANKDYSNTRVSANSTINSSNVNTLGIAWQLDIPGVGNYGGAAGSNPLILGNTVYFQDMKSNVFAMNKQTGEIIWRHDYNATSTIGPNGPAVGWGKIFVLKDLYTMAGLDIDNGNELWSTVLSNIPTTGADIQPVAYNGLVYVSTVPGAGDVFYEAGGRGILYALDQATGEIRWQFDTVRSDDLFGNPEVNSGGGAGIHLPSIQTGGCSGLCNPAPSQAPRFLWIELRRRHALH
jgi:glucose dehydrogenase